MHIEDLRSLYGENKIIPKQLEHAVLVALAHYPELIKIHIEFIITQNAFFPYASRPKISDIFKPSEKRRYQIIIADHSKNLEKVLLKNLTSEAQVGILGHELAHTAFYLTQDTLGLLKTALRYFWPSFRERFEKDTDRSTIAHGLGEELYKYSRYIRTLDGILLNNPWIEKYYLKPEDILREME